MHSTQMHGFCVVVTILNYYILSSKINQVGLVHL